MTGRLTRGALAGVAATVPMTIAMEALWRRLPRRERYPLPPREIIDSLFDGAPAAADDRALASVTLAAHFGYGAATGALYAAMIPSRRPAAGAAYGVAVWAGSYLGWIPAAGILKPATQHPARRNLLMIGAHLIWGAALAAALARLEMRTADDSRIATAPTADSQSAPLQRWT